MAKTQALLMEKIMKEREIIVMKFGGSSVENAGRFNHAASIVRDYSQEYKVVVVVSAIYGVTDRLLDVVDGIKSGRYAEVEERIDNLYQLHSEAARSLSLLEQRPLSESLDRFRADLLSFVQFPAMQPSDEDFIASYGERLSYLLLSGAISRQGVSSQPVDAANIIVTNNEYHNAKADLELSQLQARYHLDPLIARSIIPVIGGYYGLSYEGKVAVLGRGGSDYTAAAVTNILDASKLILWKEVDGIYSADPKKDPLAEFFPDVSYDKAEALARNGAKILHPESITPLRVKNIPIEVKNFDNPSSPGSRIY